MYCPGLMQSLISNAIIVNLSKNMSYLIHKKQTKFVTWNKSKNDKIHVMGTLIILMP